MDRRSLLQVTHRLGCSAHALQRILSPFVDVRKDEALTAPADVRLFVPGDDRLQHHPAAHAIESDHEPGRGQRPLGHPRLRPDHRHADARLHAVGRRAAAPLGAADHAGRDGGRWSAFWFLFRTGARLGLGRLLRLGRLLGILLISQFWTLANGIYDPRQAKRLFGFVGGGVMLGGMAGVGAYGADHRRRSAPTPAARRAPALLHPVPGIVVGRRSAGNRPPQRRHRRRRRARRHIAEAVALLRESRQIQIIALVISFGSIGAALILDQQVNMAAEVFKGAGRKTRSAGSWRRSASTPHLPRSSSRSGSRRAFIATWASGSRC